MSQMSHSELNHSFHPTPVNMNFAEATDPQGTRFQIVEISTPFGCVRLMLQREEAIQFWQSGLTEAKKISPLASVNGMSLQDLILEQRPKMRDNPQA